MLTSSLDVQAEVHPEVSWPSDCRTEYLDGYHELAEAMKLRVIGDKECYSKLSLKVQDRPWWAGVLGESHDY